MKLKDLIVVADPKEFAKEHGLPFNTLQYDAVAHACSIMNVVNLDLFPSAYYTPSDRQNFCIAGGSVSRVFREGDTSVGDIDFYGWYIAHYVKHMQLRSMARPPRFNIEKIGISSECSRIKLDNHPLEFNFINSSSSDPQMVLSTFDFNLVRLAMGMDCKLYVHPDAISDLKNREFTNSRDSEFFEFYRSTRVNTVRKRAKKYFDMGFTSPDHDFMDFIDLPGIPTPKIELDAEDYEFWGKMVEYFNTGKVPERTREANEYLAMVLTVANAAEDRLILQGGPNSTYYRYPTPLNYIPAQERITDGQALGTGLRNNVPDNGRQGQGPGTVQPQEQDRVDRREIRGQWRTDGEPGW